MPVRKRNLIASFMMAGFVACSCVSVFAETQTVDLEQTGSIEIALQQPEKLEGAVFDLYKVADLSQEEDGNLAYTPTETFGPSFHVDTDNIESDTFQAYIADYIEQNALKPVSSLIIEEDTQTCTFSDLSLGLYYVQENSSDMQKDYEVAPFLITLPSQTDGIYSYDVDTSPKMQICLQPSKPTLPQSSFTTTTLTTTPAKTSIPLTGTLLHLIPGLTAAGLLLIASGYLIQIRSDSVKNGS
jgi:hypothetical protein